MEVMEAVPGIKYLQVLGLSTPSKYLSSNDFTIKKQYASTCKYSQVFDFNTTNMLAILDYS